MNNTDAENFDVILFSCSKHFNMQGVLWLCFDPWIQSLSACTLYLIYVGSTIKSISYIILSEANSMWEAVPVLPGNMVDSQETCGAVISITRHSATP